MIGVKIGEVSIEVTTVSELAALIASPDFKQITAALKNGMHKQEGNELAPSQRPRSDANGEGTKEEMVITLIRRGVKTPQITEQTGWSRQSVYYLRAKLKKSGSLGSENTAD